MKQVLKRQGRYSCLGETKIETTVLSLGRINAILLECDGEYGSTRRGMATGVWAITELKATGFAKLHWTIRMRAQKDHTGGMAQIIQLAAKRVDRVVAWAAW